GAQHADRFRAEQSALQDRVLVEREDLREHQARIESLARFSVGRFGVAVDETMVVEMTTPLDPESPRTVKRREWEELLTAYAAEQVKFADELEAAAIDLFLKETVVPVALAGRVPVQVDGRYGHIIAGDYLSPSPIPGVAMKATQAGPTVGVALEDFDGEQGQVQMLVQRGWYGGDTPASPSGAPPTIDQLTSVAATAVQPAATLECETDASSDSLVALTEVTQAQQREITALRARLDAQDRAIQQLLARDGRRSDLSGK
ncbi:MAG: hypothetical protein KDA75_16125, partial [Planctomycetaceae bacterium]|nr:hypothetical protein [Planctomycetaceae bacterium]